MMMLSQHLQTALVMRYEQLQGCIFYPEFFSFSQHLTFPHFSLSGFRDIFIQLKINYHQFLGVLKEPKNRKKLLCPQKKKKNNLFVTCIGTKILKLLKQRNTMRTFSVFSLPVFCSVFAWFLPGFCPTCFFPPTPW